MPRGVSSIWEGGQNFTYSAPLHPAPSTGPHI